MHQVWVQKVRVHTNQMNKLQVNSGLILTDHLLWPLPSLTYKERTLNIHRYIGDNVSLMGETNTEKMYWLINPLQVKRMILREHSDDCQTNLAIFWRLRHKAFILHYPSCLECELICNLLFRPSVCVCVAPPWWFNPGSSPSLDWGNDPWLGPSTWKTLRKLGSDTSLHPMWGWSNNSCSCRDDEHARSDGWSSMPRPGRLHLRRLVHLLHHHALYDFRLGFYACAH